MYFEKNKKKTKLDEQPHGLGLERKKKNIEKMTNDAPVDKLLIGQKHNGWPKGATININSCAPIR